MSDELAAGDSAASPTAPAAAAQPSVHGAAGVSCEQLDERVAQDAAEHVAEAERHGGREQQADRPEQQQREAAGAAARRTSGRAAACQRSMPPQPVQRRADARRRAPCRATLRPRSTFEETRCGRKFCSTSIASDSSAPPTQREQRRAPARAGRCARSATNSSAPSGR